MDKLAYSGTRFDACITPNLVCQPSRASILTGQLPFTHGVCDNGIDLKPQVAEQGFAEQLNKMSYNKGDQMMSAAVTILKDSVKVFIGEQQDLMEISL